MSSALPGEDLIERGLADLGAGVDSVAALLVSIGAPRLSQLGYRLPRIIADPEHRLYERLRQDNPNAAHSRYNALVRRLVSFERATGVRTQADTDLIRRFMHELGAAAEASARVYLTGGATAVLLGWRTSTIDVDIKIVPQDSRVCGAIPALKEQLRLNVKLASPVDFIPVPPGWEERSPFIEKEGQLSFHHFDLYAQALAKVERGHVQDISDVREMLRRGLIVRDKARTYFERLVPDLYRYPAVDPDTFRAAVAEMFA
jgi:hypothetical protein